MYPLYRPILFSLPPEMAHHVTLKAMRLAYSVGLLGASKPQKGTGVACMGLHFPNRVGLAAGLDKDGQYIDGLGALGFGFLEIGTVTPKPQPGNPKPRLFRLAKAHAIINRMGFNNDGVDALVERAKKRRYTGVLGINIGKNKDTPLANAVEDYLIGMEAAYPIADYLTINISSPNTPGLRDLQKLDALRALLDTLGERRALLQQQTQRRVPIVVKIAPDMTPESIAPLAKCLLSSPIDGVIATNTTVDKRAVKGLRYADEAGGLSGRPLFESATDRVKRLADAFSGQLPIIAAGGIDSPETAEKKIQAGASLIQIYTGLIYQGPRLVKQLVT